MLAFVACAQPVIVREGIRIPVSQAAERDLAEARARVAGGALPAARQVLERSRRELRRSGRLDEVLLLLGEVDRQLGDDDAAQSAWEQLIQERARSRLAPEARLSLARLLRGQGRVERAYRLLQESAFWRVEAPLRKQLYRELADLARELTRWGDALVWLSYARRELTSESERLDLDLEIGELLEGRVRANELEAAIERMSPGSPRDRAQLESARMALDAGDPERALKRLELLPDRMRPVELERRQALIARARVRDRGGRLGVALPLSGPFRAFGERVLRGMVLGLGTFADPPFSYELVVRDTAGDPDRAARAVDSLVREGVVAILGPLRSVASVAAAPVAERAGVPLISLAREPSLPELGEYVFRFGLTAVDQVHTLVSYAVERLGRKRFAILYPRDAYGIDFKNRFWEQVEALGGEVVGVEGYPSDAVDLQQEIKKLVGLSWLTPQERSRIEQRDRLLRHPRRNEEALADPNLAELPPIIDFDALFVPDAARRVGLILPQLRFFDVRDVTLLGTSDWNDNDLIEIAGRDARGAVFTDAFFAGSPFPFVKDFVKSYYSAYGAEPERLAATGYDAGALLRSILESRPTLSRQRLRDALLKVRDFPGVAGLTSFDASGGTHHSLYLLTVKRGAIEQLEP